MYYLNSVYLVSCLSPSIILSRDGLCKSEVLICNATHVLIKLIDEFKSAINQQFSMRNGQKPSFLSDASNARLSC